MTKHVVAAVLVLAAGCSAHDFLQRGAAAGQTQVTGGFEATAVVPKMTREEAIAIARKRLQQEAFAKDIDQERMSVRYGEFGPRGNERCCWLIDFCRLGSAATTDQLWARGYWVAVDARTGEIVEASAYER